MFHGVLHNDGLLEGSGSHFANGFLLYDGSLKRCGLIAWGGSLCEFGLLL